MKKPVQKILIVGLFLSDKNKRKINRTAADQLAELFSKNGYPLITVSSSVNKITRFIDTIFTIIRSSNNFSIAIVPLYGTFFSYWWSYFSVLLLKLLNKKTVLIIHGGSIPGRMKTSPAKFLAIIKRADVVVCPSAYLQTTLGQYGVKTILIENVLNLQDYQFHLKERFRPTIFWMRTLNEIYNPEMAVRVTALLRKKFPSVKMVMAGREDGSLSSVTALAKKLGVSDVIEFPGYINNEQKNIFASALDIYICTNRIDNAPVSFVEMMALGLPIVSVNVGGIPYLIKDKITGLIVEDNNEVAMVERISAIIEQPELGKELVKNGLQFSKNFGEQPVLEKWKQVLDDLGFSMN